VVADNGPYETERQACAAAVAAIPPEDGWSILSPAQRSELLHRALSRASVETTVFEARTARWLTTWDDHTVSIIAGWIRRAYEAGKAAGPDGAVAEWGVRYTDPDSSVREVPSANEVQARHWAAPDLDPWGPQVETALIQRQVGPWKEVPDE
jgi:hypothetical protein